MSRGRIFVIAAPSGTGKTTVCRALVERDPLLRFCVSHTTRPPRAGEQDGVNYHFVSPARFAALVEEGAFLEHARYGEHRYGTSWRALEEPLREGCDAILEIEVQGARQIRESGREACFVFLLPPTRAALEARLRGRGSDSEATIRERLAIAERELAAADLFDYAVVNDDLETAIRSVHAIIEGVRAGRPEDVARHERARVLAAWSGRGSGG